MKIVFADKRFQRFQLRLRIARQDFIRAAEQGRRFAECPETGKNNCRNGSRHQNSGNEPLSKTAFLMLLIHISSRSFLL